MRSEPIENSKKARGEKDQESITYQYSIEKNRENGVGKRKQQKKRKTADSAWLKRGKPTRIFAATSKKKRQLKSSGVT